MQPKPITIKPTKTLTDDLGRLSALLGTSNTSEIIRQAVHKLRLDEDRRMATPCAISQRTNNARTT
jgi:hypothetical protein